MSNTSSKIEFDDGSGISGGGASTATPFFVKKSTAYVSQRTLLGLSNDTWNTYVSKYPAWAKKNGEIHQISSTNALVSSGLAKDFLYAGIPASGLSEDIAFGAGSSSSNPVYNKSFFTGTTSSGVSMSTKFNPWVESGPSTYLGGTCLKVNGALGETFYKDKNSSVPVVNMVHPGTFPTFTSRLRSIKSLRTTTWINLYYMTWDYSNDALKILEFDNVSSADHFAYRKTLVTPVVPSDINGDGSDSEFNTDGHYRSRHDYNFLIELQASGGDGGVKHGVNGDIYGGDGGGSGGYACFVVNTAQFFTSPDYKAELGYGCGLLILDMQGQYYVNYKFDATKSFSDTSVSNLLLYCTAPGYFDYGTKLGLGAIAAINCGGSAKSDDSGGSYGVGGNVTIYHHTSEAYSSSNNETYTKTLFGGGAGTLFSPATQGESWYCDGHVSGDVSTYGTFPFLNTTGDKNTTSKFSNYPMYLVAAIAGGSGGQTGVSGSGTATKYGADCTQRTYLIKWDIADSSDYKTQLGGDLTATTAYIYRHHSGGATAYPNQSGGNGAASVLASGGLGGSQASVTAGNAGKDGAGAGGNSMASSDQTSKLGGNGVINIWY